MPKFLHLACFGKQKNKKTDKKYLVEKKSYRMEQSEPSKVTTDYDSSLSSWYPISVEATVMPCKMKQEVQSFEVHSSMKKHSSEKTKIYSSQENLQKSVKALIDCGICTISLYQGATLKIENGAITVLTSVMDNTKDEHGEMCYCKPKAHKDETNSINVQKKFQVNICRPETVEEEHGTSDRKLTAVISPFNECNAIDSVNSCFANDGHACSEEDNSLISLENSPLHIEDDTACESEDTIVKNICSSNTALAVSSRGSETNISSFEERGSISLEASSFSSFDTWSSVGPQTLLEPENIGANTKNINCFPDQAINIGHTNKTPVENEMFNSTQAELPDNCAVVECRKVADSSEIIEKAYEESCVKQVTKDIFLPSSNTVVTIGREMVGDKLGNQLNTEKTETVWSDCNVEESDTCSNASTAFKICDHKMENVISSRCNTFEVMDPVCCLLADVCDESQPTQKEKVYVTPFINDKDSVISDTKYVRSDCKLKVEEADICSNAFTADKIYHQIVKNVLSLRCNTFDVMDPVCSLLAGVCDESQPTQIKKVYVTPVKTASLGYCQNNDMDSVISDKKYASGYGLPAQHCEESWQMQVSVGYSSHHYIGVELVKDTSIKEWTKDGLSNKECDLNELRSETFVSSSKVQEGKVSEIRAIVNKEKPVRRPKLGIICRHCPLAKKRRGRKRKVKIKGCIKPSRKVSFKKEIPRILRDLKINLHYLASSFAQDTDQGNTLTQTINIGKREPYFLTELDVVSEKKNGSQEQLIDDFLQSLASTWFIFPTIRNGPQTVILLPTGLQLYFERLLRGSPPDEREMMSYEWLRLQTFTNYPSTAPGSGIRLSRAGFYYSGNGTTTICYACGRQHSGWNFHDDPFEIHRRISPDCPFLRGNPTYPNVPIMQEREQIGNDTISTSSNAPLSQTQNITVANSPSTSNRTSDEMLGPTAFQLQNSANTPAQSSAATSPSIQNPQKGASEELVSQQTTSQVEHFLGIVPSPITSEIPSVKPVARIATVLPSTSGNSHQGQSPPPTASNVTQPQQPTDDAENTQYRNPGNFVRIKPTGHVEDPGVNPMPQTMSERPKHPEYAPLSSRVNSYSSWPVHLDQTPQQMGEAGFFYAGINDYTRCFHCGGGLRNWEPGDNPWIEHARWYPQCAYVLGKRGQKFVAAVLKKQTELLAAQNAERNNTTTTTTSTSSPAVSTTGTQPAQVPATQTGRPRYFQNPNENEIANILIHEMGYQQERVREAILEVKRTRGQQQISVEHVIELLIADEERGARAGRLNEAATLDELIHESGKLTLHDDCIAPTSVTAEMATRTQKSIVNQVAQQRSQQTNQNSAPEISPSIPQSQQNMSGPRSIAVEVPSSSAIFNNQEGSQNNKSSASNTPLLESTSLPAFDAESLREEYLRLLDQSICKICMERNIELAFLPCGHLVCCAVCGQSLRFCPICRAKIHASVKTYLS
ncbi:hypothetical protein ACJMK2_018221 [Sinanodonta woodiana]|uniref:RING-type domain-containing protein n=1 Tax=Sinanodonta woodiana TaxID=1069815 RepID=A0ABD3UCR9_SINWO